MSMVSVDDIHLYVLYGIDCAAIIINILLICIIVMRTPIAKRSYAIFLLNNTIMDICFAMASALGAARIISLSDNKVVFVYLGQCYSFGGIRFCNFCESMLCASVSQSSIYVNFIALVWLSTLYHSHWDGIRSTATSKGRLELVCVSVCLDCSILVLMHDIIAGEIFRGSKRSSYF
ncbi:hypothetical protein PRIPAC_76825 [Pristionchus pacificus]|uniref:G protein-coupled receptor n=1 Tax=Pristionchus pacificus TaxID=54126 RepID=A0A2A6CL59_PRIPA|nr:hypothetical protein PRIPAC_76825 [Pristionchus pacificus]|eukprot:PDM78849.1 G protein-coupled receptor [Pristionchus pacificus]